MQEQRGKPVNPKADGTGNSINPAPEAELADNKNQLIDKKGEKYLRESGNVEDLPDVEDEEEAGKDQAS